MAMAQERPGVSMNREPRKIVPRVCIGCAHDFGVDSPLPFSADCHFIAGKLEVSCSPSCRRKFALPERKVRE